MKLQTKLVLTVLIVFAISIFFIEVINFNNAQISLRDRIFAGIDTNSHALDNTIEAFLDAQKNKIELITIQSALSNEELKSMAEIDPSFYELFVLGSDGKVVASSIGTDIGTDNSNDKYFINARNQTYIKPVYYSESTKQYSFTVSTPFHGGVLVGRVSTEALNKIVQDKIGLGETGESLLAFKDANNSVIYFSDRRFSDQKFEVLTLEQAKDRPIYAAVMGIDKFIENGLDYRGVPVIAVTKFVDRINVGMIVKMDRAEAFASIERLKNLVLFIGIIVAVLVSVVVYLVSREVVLQIRKMTADVDSITKGNLEIQLERSGISEIQGLTDSLNRILASMKLAILRTGATKGELGLGEAIKAKESVEQRYKLLYDSAADAIMTLEPPKWNFTAGNPATVKMFNCKDEKEFVSLGPGDLSPQRQPDGQLSSAKAKKMIMKSMKEGSAYFEWTHRKYKGENFLASVLLTRVESGGKTFLQATVRDISKEKKLGNYNYGGKAGKAKEEVIRRLVKGTKEKGSGR
ncbi:MAG: PDC sensor domain-containing protein [archaeon]